MRGGAHGVTAFLLLSSFFLRTVPTQSNQADDAYSQAETLIKEGRFEQGAALASQVVAEHPNNPNAHNLLGIALTGKGDLRGADAQYQKALSIKPNFLPALKNLAINELTEQKVEEARRHFRDAERLAPADIAVQAYLGKIAFSARDYREAKKYFGKSGELQKDVTVASELLESALQLGETEEARQVLAGIDANRLSARWQGRVGLVLAEHGMFLEAIPFLQGEHMALPESYEAAYNLAVCYVETKKYEQAIDVLRKIGGGHDAEVNALLADAYEGNHQTQQAVDALRETIRLAPEDERGFINLAALCIKYESYDAGLQAVELGLRSHPNSSRLYFQRGAIHAMQNRLDLSELDFQHADQIDPGKTLTYAALGESYIQSGEDAKAVEALRPLLREHSSDATLQYLFGKAALLAGAEPGDPLFTEAKAALEAAIKLKPQFPNALVELSSAYIKESRLEEALTLAKRTQALEPQNITAYYQLAVIYRRKGDEPRAQEMLAALSKLNQEVGTQNAYKRRLHMATSDSSQADTKN